MFEGDDYTGGGALDLALSGRSAGGGKVTKVFFNLSVANTAPTAPGNLASNVQCDRVMLSWSAASDNETPAAALSYNLRVGTTPGGSQIMSPQADPSTGARRVVEMGNVQLGSTAWLRLPAGIYFWSVQAVDAAYMGSPFAAEGSFTVPFATTPHITQVARPAAD